VVVCLSAPAYFRRCFKRKILAVGFSAMSMGDASSRRSPKDISHLQTFLYCRLQLTMIGFLVLLSLLVVGTCLAETLSTGEDVTAFVRSMIDDHDVSLVVWSSSQARRSACTNLCLSFIFCEQVMVFAKSYCPHCKRTKALLFEMQQSIDVDVEFIDLDLLAGSDGPLIQKELQQVSGQRTGKGRRPVGET
jgi:glutaredoxin